MNVGYSSVLHRLFTAKAAIMSSARPLYTRMHTKVQPLSGARFIKQIADELKPKLLEIVDESSMHAEHEAMRRNHGYTETHFRIRVVSDAFSGKVLPTAALLL